MSKVNEDDDDNLSLPSGSDNSDDEDLSFVDENNDDDDNENVSITIDEEEEDEDDDDDINNDNNNDDVITFGNSIKNPTLWSKEEEEVVSDGYSDDDDDVEDVDGTEIEQFAQKYRGYSTDDDSSQDYDDNDNDNDNEDDDEDDDEDDESINNGEKITEQMRQNILDKFHPESNVISREEIYKLCEVTRNPDNIIIDENHRTSPILTKYEKTKILGLRAKQINNGANPLVDLPSNLHDINESTIQQLQDKHFDGYLVALEELKQKKIPIIIRRPLPNGVSEYWPLQELEVYM